MRQRTVHCHIVGEARVSQLPNAVQANAERVSGSVQGEQACLAPSGVGSRATEATSIVPLDQGVREDRLVTRRMAAQSTVGTVLQNQALPSLTTYLGDVVDGSVFRREGVVPGLIPAPS